MGTIHPMAPGLWWKGGSGKNGKGMKPASNTNVDIMVEIWTRGRFIKFATIYGMNSSEETWICIYIFLFGEMEMGNDVETRLHLSTLHNMQMVGILTAQKVKTNKQSICFTWNILLATWKIWKKRIGIKSRGHLRINEQTYCHGRRIVDTKCL